MNGHAAVRRSGQIALHPQVLAKTVEARKREPVFRTEVIPVVSLEEKGVEGVFARSDDALVVRVRSVEGG